MDELYRAHARTVFRYLVSLTGSTDLSEELTQETFLQALRSLDRYDGTCKITTWLCGIARNTLFVYRRKHPYTESPDTVSTPSAETEVLSGMNQVDLLKRLQTFPGETREVLYLRLLGDLSFREIGEILSRTENWARVTYFRGREKLKKELESDEQPVKL